MTDIIVTKLVQPEHCGDWHDKPLRYAVFGPGAEVQKFSTKRDAEVYRSVRRKAVSCSDAYRAFSAKVWSR